MSQMRSTWAGRRCRSRSSCASWATIERATCHTTSCTGSRIKDASIGFVTVPGMKAVFTAMNAALRSELALGAASAALLQRPRRCDLSSPPTVEDFLRCVLNPLLSQPDPLSSLFDYLISLHISFFEFLTSYYSHQFFYRET